MTAAAHPAHHPSGAPPVSAHFVNNVLAAAASYIDEDPDYARDVLAELGQFLAHRLREDPAAEVTTAQELAHTATYLRLQQARFPGRITAELPDVPPPGRVRPGAIQAPVAEALGGRLRERPGACALTLRPGTGGLELELRGDDGGPVEAMTIAIPEAATA